MNDTDALVRCLIGVGRKEDFEKHAILGKLLWKGVKGVGKAITHTTVRKGGREVTKKTFLGGTKKVMVGGKKVKKFSPLKTGIAGVIGVESIQAGRGAAIQPAGYRPNARVYNPRSRFA